MKWTDRIKNLFTRNKPVQQKAQRQTLGLTINASNAVYPSYQVIQSIYQYTQIDDIYSIISYLSDTAARVPMYGYEIIDEPAMKQYKKFGQESIKGKHYQKKAMQDLPEDDKFVKFLNNISYADRIKYFTILYISGELFLWKEVIELGPNAGDVYLHALENQNVTVIVSDTFPQQVVGYRYFDVAFDGTFGVDEIIHVKYYNPTITNGYQFRGLSPLQVLSKRITRLEAGMDASVAQMQNGGVPGIVYEKDAFAVETLGERKNDFAKYLHNSSNKGAPYFAGGEMGYIELGLSLADMDVNSLQAVDFTKLCNAYKFPEVLLNNTEASTYDNMDTALKMLYTNSILPNIYLFKDALMRSVAPMFMDGKQRVIEVDLSQIPALQKDMKLQAEALNAMWWITPNEKRAIQDFEIINNPMMNEILVDSGKVPLTDLEPSDFTDVEMEDEERIV
jgi:HK97 family phage portal protein